MSFQQGLSGLFSSSRDLDVIGHNIANANTVGMKSSRLEFSELIASSLGVVSGKSSSGIGVTIARVAQQFTQGNVNPTGNDLDVAINGGGFFQLTETDGTKSFTRGGEFKLDKEGFIVTNSGAKVMGFPTDVNGVRSSVTSAAIQLPTSAPVGANKTSKITAEFNLDARAEVWNVPVPPVPLTTYGTSVTAFDSQGVQVPVQLYMRKTAVDTWDVFTDPTDDGTASGTTIASLNFGPDGKLTAAPTITINITSPNTNIGTFTADLNLNDVTQYGARFSVSNLTQDGFPPGELISVKIEDNGQIIARYSNGETQTAAQFALANFRNLQGLTPTGTGSWTETNESGQPVEGAPAEGQFGALRSGALEESNVDLTKELVDMMTAQRNYQANAQTIKTQDQVLSTLVNLR